MTSCPACNKSVDPLRSRFVGVLDGKIVAYCSAECAGPRALAARPSVAVSPAAAAPAAPAAPAASPSPRSPVVPPRALTPPAGVRATPGDGVPLAPLPSDPPASAPVSPDSGPVIEIVHDPVSGAAERSARAKHPDEIEMGAFWSTDREKAARDDSSGVRTDDSAVRSGRAASPFTDIAPPRRRWPLVLLLIALLGGAAALIYQYVLHGKVAAATQPPPAPVVREPPAVAPPPVESPPVDAHAAVNQATAILRADLSATSQRLQRIAAEALARTGEPAACDVLAAQLGLGAGEPAKAGETSDIARLELAYALARAGDHRGSDLLAAALRSPRGEARDEAAGRLALLGDARSAPHLTDLLAISQRRLGAAEHLAHLADPHALKVLDQLRGDARTSADDKARAAIALGIAGRTDVAPALRELLDDPHVNAFAAAALAELKDAAAQPVLEHQLASPALRVRSARALRRLAPAIDPARLLPPLLAVLQRGRDFEQVQAAEAILLLAGPPTWSAYE